MHPWIPRLLAHTLPIVRKQALERLFGATAAAFACDVPRLEGLSREQCLLAYARFTADRADDALSRGDDLLALQERLYRNAYRLGRTPGRLLRAHTVGDVMALGRLFYGLLDIEFHGSGCGEVTISRCYFCGYYSPQVCKVMSAMDRGLLAGLAGTGELIFTQRITEGQPCCRGRFTLTAGGPVARLVGEQSR
jgi:hypothetical protein